MKSSAWALLPVVMLFGCSHDTQRWSRLPAQEKVAPQTSLAGTTIDQSQTPKVQLDKLKLPDGFQISVYAIVPGARSMTFSPEGVLFVGTGGFYLTETKVYAVFDHARSGKADEVRVLADGLRCPNGVAFRDGDLYVGQIERLLKFPKILQQDLKAPTYTPLSLSFPTEDWHGWKFIKFGPDGKLYVPVGAPCNVCVPDADHGKIFKVDVDTGVKTVAANGVRNSVGFDFDPVSHELWFTDNGRDMLGNEIPPDKLNKLSHEGENFGFPYCHGKSPTGETIVDPDFPPPSGTSCDNPKDYTMPELGLPAHSAAIGMRFYTGKQFPDTYLNSIFIAEHGSWNRDESVGFHGYDVRFVKIQNGHAQSSEVFVSGWLQGKTSFWGRPSDVEVGPDGSLFISDDVAGVIYKVTYKGR